MERTHAIYIESLIDGDWFIKTTYDATRFRVGKVMIAQANFRFHEIDENFSKELKEIAINGKEFNKEKFTEWLREAIKAPHLEIYHMKEKKVEPCDKEGNAGQVGNAGWKPNGSIKKVNDKIIIKIHFTYKIAPTGRLRRCDFIKELTADKLNKVYDVLQAETKQEAERIWND